MDRAQRIEVIKAVAEALAERDYAEIDLILRTFDLPWLEAWNGDKTGYAYHNVEGADEQTLVELHEYLAGPSPVATMGSGGPWKEGYFRLFLGHESGQKIYVSRVKGLLEDYGIDGFVAHDDIEPTKEWQRVIELALGTCDALAAFLTPQFHASSWTDHEVGYCLARRVPILPLMFGASPYGFMGRWQGAQCNDRSPSLVAQNVYEMLMANPQTRPKLEEGIITSVAESQSFAQANARSSRLLQIGTWNRKRLERLAASLDNIEVSRGFDARPRVDGILRDHGYERVNRRDDEVPF